MDGIHAPQTVKRVNEGIDNNAVEDFPPVKRKRTEKARAKELRDGIKKASDYSIALYRAMLAHHGGFLEDGKDMKLAMQALAEACQKTKSKVMDTTEYNDLTNLVY